MKKILIPMLLLLSVVSCKDKPAVKTSEELLQKPSVEFTSQDTAAIMQQVDHYIQLLKNHNYDSLTQVLYTFTGGNVLPYTPKQCDSLKIGFKCIPAYDARLNSFLLRSQYNNQVGIAIQIIPNGDIERGIGITKFYLNPVKFEDKWYLTILDKDAKGYEEVYEE